MSNSENVSLRHSLISVLLGVGATTAILVYGILGVWVMRQSASGNYIPAILYLVVLISSALFGFYIHIGDSSE